MYKTISLMRKFILPTMTISFLAMAAFSDIKLNSLAFMEKEDQGFVSEYDGLPRVLASYGSPTVSLLYFPVSAENRNKMSGKWLVYRYTDHKGNIEKPNKLINLILTGNSKVIIDGDYSQEFRISFMSEGNTMALVKRIGNSSYEILELKRYDERLISAKKKSKPDWKKYRNHSGQDSSSDEVYSEPESLELTLERVYNPSLNAAVLKGEHISGSVTKQDDESFGDLNATVNFGPGKVVTFDIPVLKLKNGGQFETEIAGEQVTGIVTNSGVEGYRVRIASGKFAGTVMNFVSEEQMEVLASQEEERAMQLDLQGVANNEYSDQVKENVEYTQNHAATVRGEAAKPLVEEGSEEEFQQEELEHTEEAAIDEEAPLDNEVVKSNIESAGYIFGSAKRAIASQKK